MNKLFDYLLLIFLILVMLLASSCSITDDELLFNEPRLELDGRLPIDINGFYHLNLNPTTNQTIHTIGGTVTNIYEPTKIHWDSNLSWYYNGEVVPTINSASYVQNDGTINTVIAPTYSMKNDTLVIHAEIIEWKITKKIQIVLN